VKEVREFPDEKPYPALLAMKEPARKAVAESATMTGTLGHSQNTPGGADGYAEAQVLNRLDPAAAATLRDAVMTVWAGLSGQACRVGRGATGRWPEPRCAAEMPGAGNRAAGIRQMGDG
jgi:hypothetical protein